MISTLDGAITLNGRSGMLGGPADRRVFQALRSLADVILVGAGTARAEAYGPVVLAPEVRELRERRGQAPVPPIALVTRSGNLDWSSPLFTKAEVRPIVFTTADGNPDERHGARRSPTSSLPATRVSTPPGSSITSTAPATGRCCSRGVPA